VSSPRDRPDAGGPRATASRPADPATAAPGPRPAPAHGAGDHGAGDHGVGDHGVHNRGLFDPELLDRCIACGFCLPACPTYALEKDEKSSPRGRITLMRALEAGRLAEDDPTLLHESSFCLGCRACEPVCPAGVEYGLLLEQWRDVVWQGSRAPVLARLLRRTVERRALLRLAGLVRRYARTRRPPAPDRPHVMLGCAERALFPSVSRSARSLVPAADAPADQGCCGALHAHNGDSARGAELARRLGEDLPGTILTTSGGCAGHLAHHLGTDRVRELSEYLVRDGWRAPGELRVRDAGGTRRARVTLQDSCHLRNGLGVAAQPRALLRQVADYVEMPSAASCCGSAGSYSVLRPKDSRRVLAPKLEEIERLGVDLVVAVNPGCLLQLKQGLALRRSRVRAVHLADLLAEVSRPPARRPPRWLRRRA
jgi:glycolate oxidase iron-sulfur subunit